MTFPTNQSFKDAQESEAAEPEIELKAWLRNVAVDSEGSTASGPEFSDDFPAEGAINGERHHLNFGPAAGADDKIGKSGWKSNSASDTKTKTTDDDFENDGGEAAPFNVAASNDSTQLSTGLDNFLDDFDAHTAASPLATQGSWVSYIAAGAGRAITVETASAFGGTPNGVRARHTANGQTRTGVAFTTGRNKALLSFRFKEISNDSIAGEDMGPIITFTDNANNELFQLGFFEIQRIYQRGPTPSTFSRVTTGRKIDTDTWHRFVIVIERAVPATSLVKVYMDGKQIHQDTIDTTDLERFHIEGVTGGGRIFDAHFDDFRYGAADFFELGNQVNDHDWGAGEIISNRAKITVNGEAQRVERIIPGAFWDRNNANAEEGLRESTTQTDLAQTFEASENANLNSVIFSMDRNGSPAPANDDEVWVELRPVDGGNLPSKTVIYASSLRKRAADFSGTDFGFEEFEFPLPFALHAGVRYALVITGNYTIGAANLGVHIDSGGGYANGNSVIFDQDADTWGAGSDDFIFICKSWLNEETGYPQSNADFLIAHRSETSLTVLAQGFKVPVDVDMEGATCSIRQNGAGPTSGGVWIEVWSDDGTGKPLAKIVEGVHYDVTLIDWNTARNFLFLLPTTFELTAGTQYHLVLQGDYPIPGGSPFLHLFWDIDGSSPSFADGEASQGDDSIPTVWSTIVAADFIFEIIAVHKPFTRILIQYSDDDITYGSPQIVYDNPSRTGSWTFEFEAAELKRHWRVLIQSLRVTTATGFFKGQDENWAPILFDYTIEQTWRNEKCLTVDFNTIRQLNGIEIYGHPDEDGFCKIRIEKSTGGPFTTLTGYTELVGRKKGGGASVPTEDNGVVTSDCGYLRLLFPLTSFREMRICILDNTDEFARILEVQAFRVEDWSDRVAENGYNESQDGDPLLRRINGKQINVTLKNDDDELSPRVNLIFGDQLGNGVRLFPKIGYKGDATLVPQGVFYVENWPDPLQGPANIKVKARDGSKLMNTKVRARYTTTKRTFELMEYIGNLANIASVDQNIDPTSDSIDFYLPKEVNAYQECQLLAESVAFSQFFFDQEGYMRFRAIGNSSRDTNLETATGMTDPQRVGGPPQFIGDKMYVVISNTNGAPNEDLVVMEWDIITATWTNRGVTSNSAKRHSGICQAFDGKLYIMDFDNVGAGSKLFVYDPDDLSITFIKDLLTFEDAGFDAPGQNDGAGQDDGLVRVNVSELVLGTHWILSCESSRAKYHGKHYELDLSTFQEKVESSLYGATRQLEALRTETKTGKIVALTRTAPGPPQTVKANEWDYLASTFTFKLDLFTDANVIGHTVGMDENADGFLYWSFLNNTAVDNPPARLSKLDVNAGTWVNTDLNTIAEIGKTGASMEGDGVAISDGFILAHWGQPSGNDVQQRLMARDLKNANIITTDLGPLGSGASARIGQFRKHKTAGGFHYIYGFSADFTVFEWRVRERIEKQEVAEFILLDGDGGTLRNIVTDLTDEEGGENAIINAAFIRSNPLKIEPSAEQIYEAPDLPWGIIKGTLIEYDIEYKEDCDPATVAVVGGNAVYGDSGAGTFTLKNVEIRRATISIDITATGTITGLTLEGNPLRRQSTTIAVVLGSKQSKDRYGLKQFSLNNKYIYTALNLTGIGKSLVDRFQEPKIRASGVRLITRWDTEMFDRWRLTVPRKNIDTDVYIVGIDRAYESAEMAIKLIEV